MILLFALLLWRGITLAAHAPDRFGALLVVGFVVQVALQAVLNMAVVTNTIPNTGISLPFFLRRHQSDDAAGRNGHRAVGVPRGDIKPGVPCHKMTASAAGSATNDRTNK